MSTTARVSPARTRWWAAWTVMAVFAVGISVFSASAYVTADPSLSRIPLNPDIALHYFYLTLHAFPGSLVLLLGPFQFVPVLRNRYRKLHRVVGRVYIVSVLIASVAAFLAATFTITGFSVQVAFYLLAVGWLYTITQAYRAIRQGQVQLHRIWMIRNYALAFAAVALRVFFAIGLALQGTFPWLSIDDVYHASVWSSVIVCALVAEWFIVQRTLKPLARSRRGAEGTTRASPTATSATGGGGT